MKAVDLNDSRGMMGMAKTVVFEIVNLGFTAKSKPAARKLLDKELEWYKKAAALNNDDAYQKLWSLFTGPEVSNDVWPWKDLKHDKQVLQIMKDGAALLHTKPLNILNKYYFNEGRKLFNEGLKKQSAGNIAEALDLYYDAAEKYYSSEALCKLGAFYYKGEHITTDIDKAYQYWKASSAMDYAPSMYNLQAIYTYEAWASKSVGLSNYWKKRSEIQKQIDKIKKDRFNELFILGDVENGKGIRVYNRDEIYDGQFINGSRNGYGTYYWSDGRKYEGDFKDGLLNGNGKMYDNTGTVIQTGRWENGYFKG